MLLWCEVFKTAVAQDFICDSYKDLKGHTLYKLPVKECEKNNDLSKELV